MHNFKMLRNEYKIVVKGKIILLLVSEKIIKNNEYILWLKMIKYILNFKIDTKIRISEQHRCNG